MIRIPISPSPSKRSGLFAALLFSAALSLPSSETIASPATERPNIIWLMAEDIAPDLECYGMKGVQTPVLNRLAEEGIRFDKAYTVGPICSTSRSSMMTGVHQNKINAQHHRSNRDVPLPAGIVPFTVPLREAGYTCILGSELVMDKGTKTDVNFMSRAKGPYDGVKNFGLFDKIGDLQATDAPFFAQIQLKATHRGDWWDRVRAESPDPVRLEEVELPPFMADTPVTRLDWAKYLDQMEYIDREIGLILEDLEAKGLRENTVIIFIGDNGRCNIRGKGYLHDPGLHVPFIYYDPRASERGLVRDDLVTATDITATILELAGLEIPAYMTGRSIFTSATPRDYVYGTRDLWDEVEEQSRSLYTEDFHYIRHDKSKVPFDAGQAYLEFYRPAVHVMRALFAAGELNEAQSLFFEAQKPAEELYDMRHDPFQLNNLIGNPEYAAIAQDLRQRLAQTEAAYQSPDDTFHPIHPISVDVLQFVQEEHPEAHARMQAGEEIGFKKYTELFKTFTAQKK